MRLRKLLNIILTLTLVGAFPVRVGAMTSSKDTSKVMVGKWTGDVNFTSGIGCLDLKKIKMETARLVESGTLNLRYDRPKFQFNTSIGSRYDKNYTEKDRFVLNREFFGGIFGIEEIHSLSGSINAGATWRPDKRNTYSLRAGISSNRGEVINTNATIEFGGTLKADMRIEDRNTSGDNSNFGFNSSHFFRKTRYSIHTAFDAGVSKNDRSSIWAQAKAEGNEDEMENLEIGPTYRLTPHNKRINSGVSVTFRDSTLAGIPALFAEGGLRLRGSRLLDHYSGANMITQEVWEDSLRLRENFNYLELFAEPNMRLSYNKSRYGADLNSTIQQYGNHLTDKGKAHKVNWRPLSLIGNIQFYWKPSPAHIIAIGGSRTIAHPSYQQICWYERQAAVEGQLFRGDPDLYPTVWTSEYIDDQLTIKKFHFSSRSTLSHSANEIEQFFITEDIDGRPYTVFMWDNTAYGDSFTEQFGVSWNGRVVTSSLTADYRQERRHKYGTHDKILDSNRWILRAGIGVHPGHGWDFAADGTYQGNIVTFYSILKEYITVNARISKQFKKIALTLEGRDLLDRKRVVQYFSQDMVDSWEEESRMNRRLILLGFKWNF